MKAYLSHRSRRFGYDGWALAINCRGVPVILDCSVCTTRAEARQLRKERDDLLDRCTTDIVKVRVTVEAINA